MDEPDGPTAGGATPTGAVVIVGVSKTVRSVVLISLYGCLRAFNYPSAFVTFVALAWAALVLGGLQRPWSGRRRIVPEMYGRIALHGALYGLEMLLFVVACKYLTPLRALLFYEFSSVSMVSIAGICFAPNRRAMSSSKRTGVVVLVVGYVLLLCDIPSITLGPRALQGTTYLLGLVPLGPATFGVLCIFLSNCCAVGRQQLSRRLNTEIGGAKRLHALSVAVGTAVMLPLGFAHYMWASSEVVPGVGVLYFCEVTLGCALFAVVADFYSSVMARARAGNGAVAAASVGFSAVGVLIAFIAAGYDEAGMPSFVSVLAACVLCAGFVLHFSKGTAEEVLSSANLVADGAMRAHSSSLLSAAGPFFNSLVHRIKVDPDARHIFYYLVINFSFMFMELGYGLWNNSLGLVSDACHMLFDCVALVIGLSGLVIAEWRPNSVFTFGYKRVNVLSAFINAVFLVFISCSVIFEALQRFFEPVHVHHDRLLLVSVLGFLVNLVGLFVFHQAHEAAHGHSHSHGHSHDHGHSHSHGHAHDLGAAEDGRGHGHDEALSGVYLHILGDTLGSVGVIFSSIFIEYFGWMIADPICSICIGLVIFLSVVPLVKSSGSTLLQCVPEAFYPKMNETLTRIRAIEGVEDVEASNFWSIDGEDTVGTARVRIGSDHDAQAVLSQVNSVFRSVSVTATVEVWKA